MNKDSLNQLIKAMEDTLNEVSVKRVENICYMREAFALLSQIYNCVNAAETNDRAKKESENG